MKNLKLGLIYYITILAKSLFYSLFAGVLVFLVMAASIGFFAWLIGSANPRDGALTLGLLGGGLCYVSFVLADLVRAYDNWSDFLARYRAEKELIDPP